MKILRWLRGALSVGITWGLAWAMAGISIGVASLATPFLPWHYFFDIFDAPPPALALPGFVGGLLFSAVLSALSRRKKLTEFSLRQFAALGAAGGVLLSLVPAGMVAVGLATFSGHLGYTLPQLTLVISVPFALLGAGCAAASLWIARRGLQPELMPAEVPGGLSEGEPVEVFNYPSTGERETGLEPATSSLEG